MTRTGICVAGNIVVDTIKKIDAYPDMGMLGNIKSVERAVGGCVPNTGISLAKMNTGIPLSAIGRMGDDDGGQFILNALKEHGINTDRVQVEKGGITGFSDVMTKITTGERAFFHCRGENALFDPDDVDVENLSCRILHTAYILLLDKLGVAVSISIDGFSEQANSMRIDRAGHSTFSRVTQALDTYKRLEIKPPSLSVTLTERTIEDLPSMIRLLEEYDITGLGYNVLLKRSEESDSNEYYEAASRFIIESFLALRERGVYEDRIMRKLDAFSQSRIHFSDCGATSGGQILFAPDGRIGICQGLMDSPENYVTDIWDDDFLANKHPFWNMWARLTPIYNEECLSCEALGICGGGCPVNARLLNPERGLHCIDKRSCVHAKRTLEFLIRDLYNVAIAKDE